MSVGRSISLAATTVVACVLLTGGCRSLHVLVSAEAEGERCDAPCDGAPELVVGFVEDQGFVVLQDGDGIPLRSNPQGGWEVVLSLSLPNVLLTDPETEDHLVAEVSVTAWDPSAGAAAPELLAALPHSAFGDVLGCLAAGDLGDSGLMASVTHEPDSLSEPECCEFRADELNSGLDECFNDLETPDLDDLPIRVSVSLEDAAGFTEVYEIDATLAVFGAL